MKIRVIIVFTVLSLLNSCSGNSEWKNAKKTGSVYPTEKISTYSISSEGNPQRRWVNEAYKNYEFKKYCENTVEATFYIADPKVRLELFKDSLSIARFLLDDFRKEGVCHFVGQTLSNGELKVYLYHEDEVSVLYNLREFRIPCEGMIKTDPGWEMYTDLLLGRMIIRQFPDDLY